MQSASGAQRSATPYLGTWLEAQVDLVDNPWLRGDEVTETIGGVIAASAVFIGIDFEHVFRTVGIVLKVGETFDQATATLVDE